MALLEIEHLKKYFNSARGTVHAVDDVTFSINEGETMGLVGESGCGKSTLGRTIIHLLESTDGTIRFNGQDVTHLKKDGLIKLREDMQIIFQDPYSSYSFGTKLSSALVGTVGVLLLARTGYVANAIQPPQVMKGINMIVNILPGACWLIALLPLLFYNLNENTCNEIRKRLDDRA